MGVRDKDALYIVFILCRHAHDPAPSPALLAVRVEVHSLDIVHRCQGDKHGLVLDHVLLFYRGVITCNHRTAGVTEFFTDFRDLFPDLTPDIHLVGKDLGKPGDLFFQPDLLVDDLLLFECSEAAELHLEDSVCLEFVQSEPAYQAGPCVIRRVRCPDRCNYLIDPVECGEKPDEYVDPFFSLSLVEFTPEPDDLNTVPDKLLDDTLEGEHLRLVVHDCEVDDSKGRLESRMLVQLVQDHTRDDSLLELDDNTEPVLVRLVPDI